MRNKTRNLLTGVASVALLAALGAGSTLLAKKASGGSAQVMAPRFEVDPLWPKPLPNGWLLGQTIGVTVDAQDHIWIVHRPGSLEDQEKAATFNPPHSSCCRPAPPVLEFDEAGNLLQSWGGPGPGYDWPESNHGITVDYKGNVWIGGNGRGKPPARSAAGAAAPDLDEGGSSAVTDPYADDQILKFTHDGKFLMQIGKPYQSKGSLDTQNLRLPAKIFVDKEANEAYVADGYGNHRVIVFDADTGKFKRMWGAYGNKPSDADPGPYNPDAPPEQQFRNPVHCVMISVDRLVYVCDRANDRIQVFHPDGTFIKEAFIDKDTRASGAVADIAFSTDPQQRFIYVANLMNEKVDILDRQTLKVLTSFGTGGRQPGEFYGVHSIATDSKGNIFTTETWHGQRVQKFIYKGLAPVTKRDEGVVWPKSSSK